ncbi:C40 family peptidase [Pectinatus sottacetonis]|uniref:C40 family peptidase n=1 Tax=Pectinatus sottacetonis TaxID=1002795 RepID=UPI0018C62424|nr:SH3 domain-containing protein [Pectinatus sottacetonis]
MQKNIIKVLCFVFCVCIFGTGAVMAAGITHYPPLRDPVFWQNKIVDKNKLVLTDEGKKSFNALVRQKSSCMVDLQTYPLTKSSDDVKNTINASAVFPDNAYDMSGQILTQDEKDAFTQNMNLAEMRGMQTLNMGVIVRHSNIRTMPTADPVYSSPYPSMFDMFQETAVDPGEAVIILHTSSDGKFYYVQMYNYSGWIETSNVAVVKDRQKWLDYVKPKSFLMVIGKSYIVKNGRENIFYQMGSRIPIVQKKTDGYIIMVPQRNTAGNLQEETMLVPRDNALYEGFLPYTRSNIIREAFQYLDEPYGWGGLRHSVDCSSFIANVYRTVGIYLPRNADQQENTYGTHFSFTGMSEAEIYEDILNNCKPGDALYMNGHVMLYLGQTNGIPYIIQALGSYTKTEDGSYSRQRILQVVVSDLSLHLSSGDSFAAALTSAVSFK